MARWLRWGSLTVGAAAGIAAFLYPFFLPAARAASPDAAHSGDAPIAFFALLGLTLIATLAAIEARGFDAKTVALLGVLVAMNAALRIVPAPAGASGMFFLPILAGYVFGAEFGFLLGTLSMAVSGLATGGIGPWLPYQMWALGWLGLTAAWLPKFPTRPRLEALILGLFGGAWGFLFGAIMNLWFWPFVAGDPAQSWQAGLGVADTVQRYTVFYVTTSLWWDMVGAAANFVVLFLFAPPLLRVLRRFRRRFEVRYDHRLPTTDHGAPHTSSPDAARLDRKG
ncbi:MAG: ECF transporter S component [Anaerolineae bacterium]|nr:ECF transporter S component [Anaerolineae bacterium]